MMSCHWLIARGAMRCVACGAELRLIQSELDNITVVPSDNHCAFLCENCDRPPVNPDGALPPTEPEPARSALAASLRPDESVSVPTTRPTLVPSEDDLDECEILLRRAIEMVRGSTRWSQPTRSLTDRMPGRSLSSRVVQIHHDPGDATYVATDAKSGLCVLRHRDRARLRAMCDRIGWQVVEADIAARTTERS
jgi:hypothetical protein